MKKKCSVILFTFFVLCSSSVCLAGIDLPWSTTYDCDEWLTYDDPLVCDGLSKGGEWTACGHYEEIISDANNLSGAGGKGQRHYQGKGTNVDSGTLRVYFNDPAEASEVWVRWYMRYSPDFAWSWMHYNKILYFWLDPRDAEGNAGEYYLNFNNGDQYTMQMQSMPGADSPIAFSGGWETTMGDPLKSDGKWHYYEVHLKLDTNGTNGIVEAWIDDRKLIEEFGANLGGLDYGATGIHHMYIGSNQNEVASSCQYVDFDDIAISNTGRIGPLSTGLPDDTIPPTVSISEPMAGSTLAGTVQLTANAQDNVLVENVQFKVDGANVGSLVVQEPFTYSLDTMTLIDGEHVISAVATDSSGNQTSSASITLTVGNQTAAPIPEAVLFTERFEDTDFSSRQWYDNTSLQLSTVEHVAGSTSSVEFHFLQGGKTPTSGPSTRKKFQETDEVYIKYYVKYSANWEGSNKPYHPHEFYILTNKSSDWQGPAYSKLTAYVEQNEGVPILSIQDGENIDEAQIGVDLTNVTESRAVAGCNGDSDGYGEGECYPSGTVHWNGKVWRADGVYFQDIPGDYYKNDWHLVEAYFKLNSISGGKAVADGQMQYWLDGTLLIDHNNVVMRTGANSDMMFNQFLIGPWIGDGSPVDQTMWIDDLTVGTSRITGGKPAAPVGFQSN